MCYELFVSLYVACATAAPKIVSRLSKQEKSYLQILNLF
ncbi:hypothetical protein PESP_b0567 [Pseudoalteromonas espejiana DSM 9414]|nr:hypothetical protein PESP_b0567 [Pseudoalteromonas espejiana DSM 9414]